MQKLSKDGSTHVTDEFWNTLTASIGAVLAMVGLILLLTSSVAHNKPWHTLSFAVYGFGAVSLFTSSALHHGVNGSEKTNHRLRQLDYFAIYLMIAGSLTPFCLVLLRNSTGWTILALVWFLAVIGIILKALFPRTPKWATTLLYLLMGWLGVLIFYPICKLIHWEGLAFLGAGGILYTVGSLIYLLEKPNPVPGKFGFHEIWHLLVLTSATSHFCAIFFYVLPY